MPSDLYGPHLAARALSEYEERFAAGEQRDPVATRAFEDLVGAISQDADAYVAAWVSDPAGLLAHIYRICAESQGNEAEAGRMILRTAFLPQVRGAAAHIADKRH